MTFSLQKKQHVRLVPLVHMVRILRDYLVASVLPVTYALVQQRHQIQRTFLQIADIPALEAIGVPKVL